MRFQAGRRPRRGGCCLFEFREGGCERSPGRLSPAIMSHSQNLAFVSGLIVDEEKVPSVISPITRAPAHASCSFQGLCLRACCPHYACCVRVRLARPRRRLAHARVRARGALARLGDPDLEQGLRPPGTKGARGQDVPPHRASAPPRLARPRRLNISRPPRLTQNLLALYVSPLAQYATYTDDAVLQGGFSGVGLAVLQYLAAEGAQVIVLTPEPLAPSVIQLLLLLRSSTENERLYAEKCDLADLALIRTFVKGWQKDARSGMVQDLEARIDGILFCDEDDMAEEPGIGAAPDRCKSTTPLEGVSRYSMTRLTGRHALVQLLLPILLRSAATSTSPLRIVNSVSPFYATVTAESFRPEDVDYTESDAPPYPASQPWIAQGQVALASTLLWQEFQRRVTSTAAEKQAPPPPASDFAANDPAAPEAAAAATPILALSACPGLTRSTLRALLRASPSSPSFSVLGCAAYLLVYPLVWLFAKSAEEGAQCILAALMADVYRPGETPEQRRRRTTEKTARGPDGKTDRADASGAAQKGALADDRPPLLVCGGALYREGLEVRCVLLQNPALLLRDSRRRPCSSTQTAFARRSTAKHSRVGLDATEQAGGGRSGGDRQGREGRGRRSGGMRIIGGFRSFHHPLHSRTQTLHSSSNTPYNHLTKRPSPALRRVRSGRATPERFDLLRPVPGPARSACSQPTDPAMRCFSSYPS